MTSATAIAAQASTRKPGSGWGGLGDRLGLLLLCLFAAVMAAEIVVNASQSEDFIKKHLVLDDAVYYCIPARHFVEGHGFSFDGIARTNGVQPLWAILVTLLAFLVHDDLLLLRVTAALSGFLWLLGGVFLYRFLSPSGRIGAAVAAAGWMAAGVEMRLGLCGMENGLQGCLIGASLLLSRAVLAVPLGAPVWRGRALALGTCMAAMCLNRVEFGLLAVLWGGWLLRMRLRRKEPLGQALLGLWPYALPLVVFGGAWLVFSKVYFGEWTPVSGSVKAYITSTLQNPHGNLFGSFVHHVGLSLLLAALPLGYALLEAFIRLGIPVSTTTVAWILAVVFLLPLGAVLPRAWEALRRREFGPMLWPLAAVVVFALIHLLLVAALLANFTNYCSWYFTLEIMLVWLLLGALLRRTGTTAGRLLALPAILLVLGAAVARAVVNLEPPRHNISATGHLVEVGRFCRDWLPPGSHIGAMNSGFIALEAEGHTVTNLDGLMNDGRFLRDYLSQNRLDDYIREEGIQYFADNLPVRYWRDHANGVGMRFPADMVPLFCQPSIADTVMFVQAIPTAGKRAAPPHPLAAVLWRTLVQGEFARVTHAELAKVPPDRQVVATWLDPYSRTPVHVHTDRATARTAVDAAGVAWLPAIAAEFGDRLRLLAVDVPHEPVEPGDTVLITTYWRPAAGLAAGSAAGGDLRLCLQVGVEGGIEVQDRPAHGTLPLAQWPQDQILAHSFVVQLPPTFHEGEHPLRLSVRQQGAPLPIDAPRPDGAADGGRPTSVRAGTLGVRRW